ncbi:MAG TPA: YdcF family protein [Terriglobia bacterium]|nr:YdcF family protein [Terriglobia bacterium]
MHHRIRWISVALIVAASAALGLESRLYLAVRRQASTDEARKSGAIVIFGAAQYDGKPSPVFKARLDHAFDLEERGLAPLVITTGAGGGDRRFTEAGVGRDYLVQQGLAADKILTDSASQTTYASVQAVARLLLNRNIHSCVAVSDGFHLYRVKQMLEQRGIQAYASPDPDSPLEADPWNRTLHTLREVISTTAWYLGYKG